MDSLTSHEHYKPLMNGRNILMYDHLAIWASLVTVLLSVEF